MLVAKQQPEPQRLCFVFLRASLPDDHNAEEEANFQSGQGGELEPIMCVDKLPEELGSFEDLVTESELMDQDWQIVLIAGLSGNGGTPPTSEDAQKPLDSMEDAVRSGRSLSNYLALDRTGSPVHFH